MKNPYASRWQGLPHGDREESILAGMEAREAEQMDTETCGGCGSTAYYRPGVGAYQCPTCGKLKIDRHIDGNWVTEWR